MSNPAQFHLDELATFHTIITDTTPKSLTIRGLSSKGGRLIFETLTTEILINDTLVLMYDKSGNSIYIEKYPKASPEQFDGYVCLITLASGEKIFGSLNSGFYIYEIDFERNADYEECPNNLWNEEFEGKHINSLYRQTHIAQHLL